jgi:hypothetical protein
LTQYVLEQVNVNKAVRDTDQFFQYHPVPSYSSATGP